MTGPAYRSISEVAELTGVPQHVLRFWETKFPQIAPLKRGGNRRFYRPEDIVAITTVARLLHTEGYTIRGAQALIAAGAAPPPPQPAAPAPAPAAPAPPSVVGVPHAALRMIRDDLAAALAAACAT